MSSDGIYEIVFATWQAMGTATVHVKDGKFCAVTNRGSLLEGRIFHEEGTGRQLFELNVTIPPGTQTVTGIVAGETGRTIAVTGQLPPQAPDRRFSISLAGKAVDIALKYLGPIPPG